MLPGPGDHGGHDSYPRAIRTTLGGGVEHRTNRYLNNRLEQDHRGIKGRYQSMALSR
jgi:putative transposase